MTESIAVARFNLAWLADGREWLCPIARGAIDSDGELGWCQNLPAAVGLDAEGEWTRQGVVAKYAPLWAVAMRWWDAFAAASPDEDDEPDAEAEKTQIRFEFADVNDAALLALATNYRVGKAEVALLGLFDDRATVEILKALIDWPTIQGWIKKKARSIPAGSSSDAGPPAEPNTTGPASATSGP